MQELNDMNYRVSSLYVIAAAAAAVAALFVMVYKNDKTNDNNNNNNNNNNNERQQLTTTMYLHCLCCTLYHAKQCVQFGITWHYKRFNVTSRKRIQQICHTDVGSFIVPTKIIHNATLLVAVGNHQQHRH
uniref:Uncharacterized protein n=1 Tax=Glossina pallidipes TaxID=7398 RepID=A0A1A9Z8S3_GLOPL